MIKKVDKKKLFTGIIFVCVLIMAVLEFFLHRKVVFMMDDLWYATNLATGEPLRNVADVMTSQIWHFLNWGGRCINHGLLQLVLMSGELVADILNLLVTFSLCYLICELAGRKHLLSYCVSFILLISLNADLKLSMIWQSGSVNYLYSTNWILLFLIMYMRQVKNPDAKAIKGIALWMVPLGLITGWSNENMGPASFVTAVIVIIYFYKLLKRRPPLWMWSGAVAAFLGSILVIAAPGNFVRNAYVKQTTFLEAIYERFLMMLTAGADFLFPSFLFLLVLLLLYLRRGNKLQPFQVILLITIVLAYGAMVLSPTFPGRASFGIMVLCIVLMLSFMGGIEEKDEHFYKYIVSFSLCMWVFSMYVLIMELSLPLVGTIG